MLWLNEYGRALMKSQVDHNVVDTSGATQKMLRPDLIALLHDVLIFKAEEKKDSDEFDNAVKELESKMERWDPSLFGELPYLPCYAAAKEQFQWFIIGRDLTAYPISPRYNLSLLLHRVLVSYIQYPAKRMALRLIVV